MFRGIVCNVALTQRPLTLVTENNTTRVRCRIHKAFRTMFTLDGSTGSTALYYSGITRTEIVRILPYFKLPHGGTRRATARRAPIRLMRVLGRG